MKEAELRKLASAATPGEYAVKGDGRQVFVEGGGMVANWGVQWHDDDDEEGAEKDWEMGKRNAAFAAAANPARVLRLLDDLAAAKAESRRYSAAYSRALSAATIIANSLPEGSAASTQAFRYIAAATSREADEATRKEQADLAALRTAAREYRGAEIARYAALDALEMRGIDDLAPGQQFERDFDFERDPDTKDWPETRAYAEAVRTQGEKRKALDAQLAKGDES